MLRIRRPRNDNSTQLVEAEAPAEPVELRIDPEPPVAAQLLEVARTYRPENRQADYLRLLYSLGDRAGDVTVSVSWETLAQIRSELGRWGHELGDDDILGFIIVPWALDHVAAAPDALPPGDTLTLTFDDDPRPLAVGELLSRYGFLPAEFLPAVEVDRPWVWEG